MAWPKGVLWPKERKEPKPLCNLCGKECKRADARWCSKTCQCADPIFLKRNPCKFCGRKCLKYGARWCSLDCRYADPAYLEEHRQRCNTPAFKEKIGEITKKMWNDPNKRKERIESLIIGGMLRNPTSEIPQSQLNFVDVLCPVGYLMNEIIINTGKRGKHYKLDFGHLEAKVNIEIDGSSHKGREALDKERDVFLRSLGWKVIRIKV